MDNNTLQGLAAIVAAFAALLGGIYAVVTRPIQAQTKAEIGALEARNKADLVGLESRIVERLSQMESRLNERIDMRIVRH